MNDPFLRWLSALEARHLAGRPLAETRRGLQALTALYVEKRTGGDFAAALDGAGKRAAFAFFYGALHFLAAHEAVRALGAAAPAPRLILDLGCGTGAAGAAWAAAAGGAPALSGVEINPWAAAEARWTWGFLGLKGRVRRGDLRRARLPGAGAGIVLGWAANELDAAGRAGLLPRLLAAARAGARMLVIEPIARRVSPWWPEWSAAFRAAGGRDDDWRFAIELPETLRRLDRAAGLDHGELTARSLWLALPPPIP